MNLRNSIIIMLFLIAVTTFSGCSNGIINESDDSAQPVVEKYFEYKNEKM